MKDVIDDIDRWLANGEYIIALATVIDTWGSAPRKVGAKMAFTPGGREISGSVSGGCVEGAVINAGDEVLATGRPQLLHYGVDDEAAWSVGLACGGTIDVFLERLDINVHPTVRDWIEQREHGAIATIVRGPDALIGRKLLFGENGEMIDNIDVAVNQDILPHLDFSKPSLRLSLSPDIDLFIDIVRPSPTIAIVGGAHIAIALSQMAKLLNFRTVLIDPRRAFGNQDRFPGVDRIISAFPDKAFADEPPVRDMAIVTLSHDPKIDDPAIRAALNSDVFYIGALGSRKTNARRRSRLASLGFTEAQLARIHAPVGLDIGADNPEEIALAIIAEIVAIYRGRNNERQVD